MIKTTELVEAIETIGTGVRQSIKIKSGGYPEGNPPLPVAENVLRDAFLLLSDYAAERNNIAFSNYFRMVGDTQELIEFNAEYGYFDVDSTLKVALTWLNAEFIQHAYSTTTPEAVDQRFNLLVQTVSFRLNDSDKYILTAIYRLSEYQDRPITKTKITTKSGVSSTTVRDTLAAMVRFGILDNASQEGYSLSDFGQSVWKSVGTQVGTNVLSD